MILQGDWIEKLKTLADESVQCCVTSPPYWGLRSYLPANHALKPLELGQEKTPQEYVAKMVEGFQEVRRVLKAGGTLWLNLGDSYAGGGRGGNPSESQFRKQATNVGSLVAASDIPIGLKHKDLVGIPWRVAFALQADGWYLRSDIIWAKPNPMPESVTDRPTKAHEYIFLMSKSERYYYDAKAIAEPATNIGKVISLGEKSMSKGQANGANVTASGNGNADNYIVKETRNKRSVWTVSTKPYKGSHFATFPPELIRPCILAGSRQGDTVLDPFGGSGTVGQVCKEQGREYILIELNSDYVPLIQRRLSRAVLNFQQQDLV